MSKVRENAPLFDALDALEKEKGIPKEYMLEKIEAALVSAYKKAYANSTNVRVILDPVKKDCRVFSQKTVVEEVENENTEISLADAQRKSRRYVLGTVVEEEIRTKEFSRTSAQIAKQVIIQGIREAERGMLIKEYEDKREEIITATVIATDAETGAIIVDTGTSEAVIIKNEQIPGEKFEGGEHIKVFVTEVSREQKGRLVTLSRVHPGLVKRLFELEVPEIKDGTVIIENITREAGSRTKMSVYSRDEDVDAIGACIGNKGSRISAIVNELSGEKIDIIKYSEDPCEYISAALSPANVLGIRLDGEKSAKVVVDADQLDLAIGQEGQNARLAAKLTGYKIDIKPEGTVFEDEVTDEDDSEYEDISED